MDVTYYEYSIVLKNLIAKVFQELDDIESDTDESDEDLPDIELSAGNKDTCVLEVNFN